MTSDGWPSPDAPPAPLPRIEDLPLADQGYDQEAVRLAFDSFYRHAAQLDASLRALEAVEVFRRDADALRNDLRALRALGLGGGAAEPAWATTKYERPPRGEVPAVALRLAAEFALIVAVAVIAGVAHFRAVVIVALMVGAFVIVAFSEWLAARARFVPPAVAFYSPEVGEPAPYVEAPAPGWEPAAVDPVEDTEADALTAIEAPAVEAPPEDDVPADDPAPEDEALEDDASEDEALEEEAPEDEAPEDEAAEHEPPADDAVLDPWEQEHAHADDEPEPALVERSGRFRRRRR